jgi:ribosomal protein S25
MNKWKKGMDEWMEDSEWKNEKWKDERTKELKRNWTELNEKWKDEITKEGKKEGRKE